jgi:hypothetical protein
MSLEEYPLRSSVPETYDHFVKFVGGSSTVTAVEARGVTVTYVSTGVVDLVWKENPGAYLGPVGHNFEATTQSALKGYTVVPGVFNTTTFTLRLNITNASDALTDLAALQWLSITLKFKRAGSTV